MSERDTSMEEHKDHQNDRHEPGFYEIRIQGHLDDRRAAWFEGLTLTREENGDTVLAGPVVDQAALHGLLRKVRDLGMPLLSVTLADPATQMRNQGGQRVEAIYLDRVPRKEKCL